MKRIDPSDEWNDLSEKENKNRHHTDDDSQKITTPRRRNPFTSGETRMMIIIVGICVVIGAFVGIMLTSQETTTAASDFIEKSAIPETSTHPEALMNSEASAPVKAESEMKTLRPSKMQDETSQGSGDPRTRMTNDGVLGILSGEMKSREVASADIFGQGGYASDIDAILQGVGGLKSGGTEGVGRRGVAGIGYGAGFGAGSGDIDDRIASIQTPEFTRGSMTQAASTIDAKKVRQPASAPLTTWKRSAIIANSSRLSVGENDSLPLKGVQIAVQIDGFRARVLMDCYYLNTYSRQLEGTFKLRLPHEASPYYLAFGQTVLLNKDKNGIPFDDYKDNKMALTPEAIRYSKASSWSNVKEARIVPREKAAYAFTESTHRRVDPALLEWAGADIFNCRVFPLAPQALHRIVVGYDIDLQTLGNDKILSVPVPSTSAPVIIDLDMAQLVNCQPVISPDKKAFEYNHRLLYHFENPSVKEIAVRYSDPGAIIISGSASRNRSYWAASVTLDIPETIMDKTDNTATFLVDASLSSNPDNFNIWLSMLDAILKNNEDQLTQFNVLFFNVESFWWQKSAVPNTAENRQLLGTYAHSLVLEGATDLGQVLSKLAASEADHKTLFLLSDDAITWGEEELATLTSRLPEQSRLFAYTTGASGTDSRTLEHLSRSTGGSLFTIASEDQIGTASRAFRNRSWHIDSISIDGCSDPLIKGRPDNVYNGQSLTIAGRGECGEQPELLVTLSQDANKKTLTIPFRQHITTPLAERAYGCIATSLLEGLGASAEKYAQSYALHFGIPEQTCALLMLESEQDYVRYHIDANSDALTVVSFPASRLIAQQEQAEVHQSTSAKTAFVAWLHKLEQLPDINFRISTPLEMAIATIPDSAFTIAPKPLTCTMRDYSSLPEQYRAQIVKGSPSYTLVDKETRRRMKSGLPHDALRAISSLVECNPGNTELMRDIGYNVMEFGLDDHAYYLFRQVARNRPFEPQTYQALGQVLTRMENADLAVIYYEIALSAQWNPRYGDFRKIAGLDYMHLLRSIGQHKVKVHFPEFAEARLGTLTSELALPDADLMIAITWNTDNTDIDLHVLEPSGEECFYQNNVTRIGGRLSSDVTQGYGPEMYVLNKAPKGAYSISVNNYASNNNRTGVRTKIYATVYRNWGRPDEKLIRKTVTLQEVKESSHCFDLTI